MSRAGRLTEQQDIAGIAAMAARIHDSQVTAGPFRSRIDAAAPVMEQPQYNMFARSSASDLNGQPALLTNANNMLAQAERWR